MFRKFINWKKNIEPIQWHGLNVYFDVSPSSYGDLWATIRKLLIGNQKMILVNDLIENKSNVEESKYSTIRSLEEYKESLLTEYISLARIKISTASKIEKIIFQIHAEHINEMVINKILSLEGIYFAVFFNPYFKKWESKRTKKSFYYQGGLKEIYDPSRNGKVLDRTIFPGRYTVIDEFSFLGGSEYWFSQDILTIDRLKSIPNVKFNVIESNDVIHVKLFDLPDYWEDASQKKIAMLRKLLDIDAKTNRD